jgi:aspartate ammonia-lyase
MVSAMSEVRVERDALGPVEVPRSSLYGAHTVRALANSLSSGPLLADCPEFVAAFAHVKAAAAQANAELGVLDAEVARAIVAAADEIVGGLWLDQFPLPLLQGGGGTATNLAFCEVLANRAAQILGSEPGRYDVVHPFDHVNRSQSTNDVYPTALQLAVVALSEPVLDALEEVARALEELAERHADLERLGRTCLRDAVPVPVAAYHAAQAAAVRRTARAIGEAAEPLHAVPLGATAVGTGVGAPEGYRDLAVAHLRERTGREIRPAPDLFDALAHLDPLLALANALSTAAVALAKIAADLRLLSSGPVGGIGEVALPAVQVGSSIMPGKVNPVVPELVIQVSFELRGSAAIVESAVAAGELDLNVMGPGIARQLFRALADLEEVAHMFATRCLAGLRWNETTVADHLEGSLQADVERAVSAGHDLVESEIAARTEHGLGSAIGSREEGEA